MTSEQVLEIYQRKEASKKARRKEIARFLEQNPKISTRKLAAILGYSSSTIGQDIKVLAHKGKEDLDLKHNVAASFASFRNRARQYGATDTLTTEELTSLVLESEGCCSYCKEYIGLHYIGFDHIIPLSKGGDNSVFNITACCLSCNRAKKDNFSVSAPESASQSDALKAWFALSPKERLLALEEWNNQKTKKSE